MAAPRETAYAGQARVLPSGAALTTQGAFYTDGSDNLRLVTICSLPNVTVTISGRVRNPDGTIGRFKHTQKPNSDRTVKTTDFPLAEGYVLNVTAVASGNEVPIGACFVTVHLIGGFSGATEVLGSLVQGYVTARQYLAWPGSPLESSIDGPGYVYQFRGGVVPAGAPPAATVPNGARWEVLAVTALLTTDATVVDRTPRLVCNGVYGVFFFLSATQPIGASQSAYYTWTSGLGVAGSYSFNFNQNPLPISIPITAGLSVYFDTLNFQAGDQWSPMAVLVREWLEAA